MVTRIAVLNDSTTTGGRIIHASGTGFDSANAIALIGDLASCPKCNKGIGKIIEGASDFIIDGKKAAYHDAIIACGCPIGQNRIIALKSDIFVSVPSKSNPSVPLPITLSNDLSNAVTNNSLANISQSTSITEQQKNNLQLEIQNLLNCANEVCEKHFTMRRPNRLLLMILKILLTRLSAKLKVV